MNDPCPEFLKNSSINPKTGRKIKHNGPVYRQLERECIDIMHREVCLKFFKNPSINPRTGRQIKKNGPVYNKLTAECNSRNWLKSHPLTNLQNSPVFKSYPLKNV